MGWELVLLAQPPVRHAQEHLLKQGQRPLAVLGFIADSHELTASVLLLLCCIT